MLQGGWDPWSAGEEPRPGRPVLGSLAMGARGPAGARQRWPWVGADCRAAQPGLGSLAVASTVTASCFGPDLSESAWRGRLAPRSAGPRRQPGDASADPEVPACPEGLPQTPACKGPEHPGTLLSKPLLPEPVRNGESHGREGLASLILDTQRPLGDLDRGFLERSRLRKVQTFPRLLPEGPEASALCLSLTSTKNQLPTPELLPPDPRKAFSEEKNGLSSFKAQLKSGLWPEPEPELQWAGALGAGHGRDRVAGAPSPVEESPPPHPEDPHEAGQDPRTPGSDKGILDGAGEPGSTATEQVGDDVTCSCCTWPGRGPAHALSAARSPVECCHS